jgi:cytochrome c oxidase cbb3-type subunit 4
MDLNDIRSLVTLISLALFLGLMAWTWWPARRQAHDAAALLPFVDEQPELQRNASRGEPS